MTHEIKPYDPWMFDYFYSLNKQTVGEMNVTTDELGSRVSEFASYFADKGCPFFTAWADGKMVGYCLAKRDDRGRKQSSAHVALLRIVVHPDYQAQGIGTALIEAVLKQAKDKGIIKRLEVLNYEPSIDDRHWFEKVGFEVEGKLRNRIFSDGKLIDAYIMGMII